MMEEHSNNPKDIVLESVEFDYEEVNKFNLDKLIGRHSILIHQEVSLKTRLPLVRYQRGLIYLRAHSLIKDFEDLKRWFFDQFEITYKTATAYMSVASLISAYPLSLES